MGHNYMTQNNVKLTVDKEYLISTLLFLVDKVEACYRLETDNIIDSLIDQVECGKIVPETVADDSEE